MSERKGMFIVYAIILPLIWIEYGVRRCWMRLGWFLVDVGFYFSKFLPPETASKLSLWGLRILGRLNLLHPPILKKGGLYYE